MTSEQCKSLNDSAESELSLMLGFSGNESSSDISDYNESSDEDDRSSTNDNKDSERNSDGGVWGERGKREAKREIAKRENPNLNLTLLFFSLLPLPPSLSKISSPLKL